MVLVLMLLFFPFLFFYHFASSIIYFIILLRILFVWFDNSILCVCLCVRRALSTLYRKITHIVLNWMVCAVLCLWCFIVQFCWNNTTIKKTHRQTNTSHTRKPLCVCVCVFRNNLLLRLLKYSMMVWVRMMWYCWILLLYPEGEESTKSRRPQSHLIRADVCVCRFGCSKRFKLYANHFSSS